jgi:hypothetical protein
VGYQALRSAQRPIDRYKVATSAASLLNRPYRLTAQGHEVPHDLLVDFGPAEAASEAEFTTRAHFHLLYPSDRLEIL